MGSAAVWAPGCSGDRPVRPPVILAGAATSEVLADWDDVEAAVSVALSNTELVKVGVNRADPARRVYTLRTSKDEPAGLTIERLGPLVDGEPVTLLATCSIGRFGDAEREREFLGLIVRRLEQLRGVEVAPLRD